MPVGGGSEELITDALHVGYWGHFAVIYSGIYFLDSDAKQGPTILFYDFHSRHTTPVLTLEENPLPLDRKPRGVDRRPYALLRPIQADQFHRLDGKLSVNKLPHQTNDPVDYKEVSQFDQENIAPLH